MFNFGVKFSVDTIKMISRDIKLTKPKVKDNQQSLILIRLVRSQKIGYIPWTVDYGP